MKLLIYQTRLDTIGGVETFVVNFVKALWQYYDIKILYDTADSRQLRRIGQYVELERYDRSKKYETDIFMRTSTWKVPIDNIKAKKYVDMCHNDYKYLKSKGVLSHTYTPLPWECETVGCGENAAEGYRKTTGKKAIAIENLLGEKKKPEKILKLFSSCRLNDEKGLNNMVKLRDMLRKAGIKFEWRVFTTIQSEKVLDGDEIHYYKPQYDLHDYIADSDYSVLLSKLEGLPYQILEALQYETPCIVTDIPGNTEKIKDGKNGYVVPVDKNGDIKDFDVKKLLKIPKVEEYSNNSAEKWKKFFGGAKFKNKPLRKIEEIPQKTLKVIQTCECPYYSDIEIISNKPGLLGWVMKGDEVIASNEIAEKLIKEKICERGD